MTLNIRAISAACVLVFLTGCSPAVSAPSPEAVRKPYVEYSEPHALSKIKYYYIAPIETFSVQGDHLRRIEDAEVETLAEEFRAKLIRSLGDRYTAFPQPANNVAHVRVAISDVQTTYAAFQLLPGFVVPNALRGGASVEMEFLDSHSKRRLVVAKDTRQGERQGYFSGLRKWDGVKRAFDEWVMMFNQATRNS